MTSPTDTQALVERLRKRADQIGDLLSDPPKPHPDAALLREAAAEISTLKAKLAEAMEVARPFADRCDDLFNDWCPDETPAWHLSEEDDPPSPVTVGDFRAARRLIEESNNG